MPTTGVGSLPHLDVVSAVEYSFRHTVPFAPELPFVNPSDWAVPHAVEGLAEVSGGASGWKFESWTHPRRVIHPGMCWETFVARVRKSKPARVKIQFLGPVTLMKVLRLEQGVVAELCGFLTDRLAVARQRLLEAGAGCVLMTMDEPALSGEVPAGLSELLVKLSATGEVGLHCCGEADWDALLSLPLSYLSFDANLHLSEVVHAPHLRSFLERGGQMGLGVASASRDQAMPFEQVQSLLKSIEFNPKQILWTATCGLALASPEFCERVLSRLNACDNAAMHAGSRFSSVE